MTAIPIDGQQQQQHSVSKRSPVDLDPAVQLALQRMTQRVRQRQLEQQLTAAAAASADLTALPPLSDAAKNAAIQRIRLRVLNRELPENAAGSVGSSISTANRDENDIIVVEGFGPDSGEVTSEFEEAMERIRERSRRRQEDPEADLEELNGQLNFVSSVRFDALLFIQHHFQYLPLLIILRREGTEEV